MKSSKHALIKQYLIGRIADGSLAVGTRSPSENELSRMFNVHHCTAEKALRDLAVEGYIERRRGSGSYIRKPEDLRSGNIAVIVNDAGSGFFNDLIKAIQKSLEKYKKHLIFFSTSEKFEWEHGYVEQLIEQRKADGFIIVPALSVEDEKRTAFYTDLRRRKVPFVLVFPPTPQPECHTIQTDDRQGTYDATTYLIRQGHRKIGFVIHELPGNVIQQLRLEGYRQALHDAKLQWNEEHLVRIPYPSIENGLKAGEIIYHMADRPTAFLAVSDLLTAGMAIRLREYGISGPNQILLIGNGNIDLCQPGNLNLSTIDDSLDQVGESAVRVLLKDIDLGQSPPVTLVIPQQLIIRNP